MHFLKILKMPEQDHCIKLFTLKYKLSHSKTDEITISIDLIIFYSRVQ